MPKPGGESDKLGNRYERTWTIGRLLDVANGKSESVIVEPISEDATGIEFVLRRSDGSLEYHSAKRQRAKGDWSLSALAATDKKSGRSLLRDLFSKLAKKGVSRVCFLSSTGANDFRELTERAARRNTLADFEADLNNKSSGRSGSSVLRQSLERHLLPIASDWATAYDYLQRTRVVLIDEASLTQQVDQHVAFLVYRPDQRSFTEAEVRLLLGDFVLSQLGAEIRADAIWDHLRGFGYAKRDWAVETAVRDLVRKNNREYVHSVETELINGMRLPRDESRAVIDELKCADGAKTILVSAAAGVGKSCVIAQTIDAIETGGVPVLVIRMDRHGDARAPGDIGTQMDLPKSPAVVLAGISDGGESVLVVDQLDAVSQVSGRYPHLFETFDALCREVVAYPNMRLVVACREFDLQHDHRLRKLKQPDLVKHISVQQLPIATVEAALAQSNIATAVLTLRQKELLQTPLQLFLFLDGLTEECTDVGFRNIGDLFDRYWQRKQKAVALRLEHESSWIAVIDKVCDTMSRSLAVAVPLTTVDEWDATAAAMQTEHVLVRDGKQLRFFHESFFDYAFARRFCASGQNLLTLLHSGEQHLFRRSQVRQVLSFLRDHDRDQYRAQLRALLTNGQVRFHIKRMVFAWLGMVSDPSEDEWAVLEPLLPSADGQRHILPVIRHNLAWFDLIHKRGVVAAWLESSDPTVVNRGVWLLTWDEVQKNRSEEASALLAPYRGRDCDWNHRLRAYFRWGNAHYSRSIQDLFLKLLDDGLFDEPATDRHDSWWNCLRDSAQHAPLFAIEALKHWLDRMCSSFARSGGKAVIERSDYNDAAVYLIQEVARREPVQYVAEILPRVLTIVALGELPARAGLRRDATWGFRMNHDSTATADAILNALVSALQHTAALAPEQLESLIGGLFDTDWDTIAFLLLRSCSANPERFGDRCIRFLASDSRRLDVGYGSWIGGGTGYAAISREAIATCLPFATAAHRDELEAAILNIAQWEEADDFAGWAERLLLEAFGERNLSEGSRIRLSELRTKFPQQDIRLPKRGAGMMSCVGSPVPQEVIERFTDDEWLAAMHKYDYGWDLRQDRSLKGSAVELSRQLQPEARCDRRRFAALVSRMDDTIRPEYFDAILDGISGRCNLSKEERDADDEDFRGLDTEIVLEVIRLFHRLPNRPCGRSICSAFEKLSDRQIPEADLEVLSHYAIDDPNPASDEWLKFGAKNKRDPADEAHFYGYNSVRGHAARAIGDLLFDNYNRSGLLLSVVGKMLRDPSFAVRTCVFEALLPVLNHDRDSAVCMFLEANDAAEIIFGSSPCEDFVRYATSSHYPQLRELLLARLRSPSESSVAAAARQICIAGLTDEVAATDVAALRTGSPTIRSALAEVYACNVADKTVGSNCRENLPVLFSDEAEEVRVKAASCFLHLNDADFGTLVDVIRAYIESPSFPSRHDGLLHKLEDSTWQLPEITLRLAERFVAACGATAGDISTAAAGDAPTVAKLVVRLYTQSSDETVRSRCLDLIDEMERLGFYGIDSQLMEHDR